jgi:transcription antitermination factor NusG
MEFAVNQQVLITSGTFMDKRAIVVDVRRKEVKVAIESLGQELVAYIDKTKLSILEHVL